MISQREDVSSVKPGWLLYLPDLKGHGTESGQDATLGKAGSRVFGGRMRRGSRRDRKFGVRFANSHGGMRDRILMAAERFTES
jgi:hypothetical protein